MNNDLISRSAIINALDKAGTLTDYGKYIIENAPIIEAREQWISVEDRLPEESGYYLTLLTMERYMVLHFSKKHRKFNCYDTLELSDLIPIEEVTHWMPLPEPPKED